MVMVFVLGFFSGAAAVIVAGLALIRNKDADPVKAKPRPWSRVESFRYYNSFDFDVPCPMSFNIMALALPPAIANTFKTKPPKDGDVMIDPGFYSVDLNLHLRFVERDRPASGS